ncbi:MAG TPA: trypsin-like peptidase domain-containing protein [Nitrospiraceae bacterium]|nr:trypsin-like peptidase domain-containing protein [Nitrospiraceae bacterium]
MLHWILGVLLSCLLFSHAEAASRADLIRHAKAATVLIVAINDATRSISMGSGFFVTDDGLFVTNAHVIETHSRLVVYINNDMISASPEVVAVDADADLAVLRVHVKGAPTLPLAGDNPEEGSEVITVGYPRITDILQMGFTLHPTVGAGTVSGMAQGRSRTTGHRATFVQTSGILNFGNSGGPLIDMNSGHVVGMVVTTVPYLERAKDKSGAPIGSVSMKSGIGYSIPAPVIREWLAARQLSAGHDMLRPAKGIPKKGPDADAERSFATGHVLHTIALVLHYDSDLLRLAIYHYEAAAQLKPDTPWILHNLGLAYADDGQWQEALQAYTKGLEQTPADPALLNDAGLSWERMGRPKEAAEYYRAALHSDARFSRAHNNLGHLLWESGKTDEAIAEFRAALDADPTLASASYNLGVAFEAKGLRVEAARTWESFLQKKSGQQTADEWTSKIREGLDRVKSSTAESFPAVAISSR